MSDFNLGIYKIDNVTELIFSVEDKMIMVFHVSRSYNCYNFFVNLLKNNPNADGGCLLNLVSRKEILEVFREIKPNLSSKGLEVVAIFEGICRREKIEKLEL